MQRSAEVQQAHSAPIRDVDAARQHEHLIATAGDDAKVRYWDLRCAGRPANFSPSCNRTAAVAER